VKPHAASSLCVTTCQNFLKRLRSRLAPIKIRFFLCGEYGEERGRPHYHAIIFGYDFPDKVALPKRGDFVEYSSALLDDVWGLGLTHIGSVTFDSANYVANYATKKITGKGADAFYRGRRPEFVLMSRRPGIGFSWINEFRSDVYPSDEVISRGVKTRPPRYYDKICLFKCLQSTADLMERRESKANELEDFVLKSGVVVAVAASRNARRLQVREVVARAKLSLKRRALSDV